MRFIIVTVLLNADRSGIAVEKARGHVCGSASKRTSRIVFIGAIVIPFHYLVRTRHARTASSHATASAARFTWLIQRQIDLVSLCPARKDYIYILLARGSVPRDENPWTIFAGLNEKFSSSNLNGKLKLYAHKWDISCQRFYVGFFS